MQSLKKIHAWAQMKVPLCAEDGISVCILSIVADYRGFINFFGIRVSRQSRRVI